MSDLFDITPQLSPRLKWMRKHEIILTKNKDGDALAYKSGTRHSFTHKEEVDAIVGLAKKLHIKLWNEE